ncbi:MAG: dihydroorotase, homodimeric type [Monoraphidium minutum]|nr:MAG: dihydroorotase, homodimeric type [Monoraphidium minutum]
MLRQLDGCSTSGRALAPRAAAAPRPRGARAASSAAPQSLTITAPDDWHLHVRDGDSMRSVVPHTAAHFRRAIIMPNTVPPVTTPDMALKYKARIMDALPEGSPFTPLMTLYLTDITSPGDVAAAKDAGVAAFKLYPAGATTNSDSGVTSLDKVLPALAAMAELQVPLLVHGEVTDDAVDMFDREAVFIKTKLVPLLERVPELRVVMEHITTADAAEFVAAAPPNVAATVTPQHMLLNRNALFVKGLRPHNYCLPVLKRERHREAVAAAAASGSAKFFLGTDSAPHARHAKEAACGCAGVFSAPIALALYATAFEQARAWAAHAAGALDKLEGFASHHGPDFYGLPRNSGTVTLVRAPFAIPQEYGFGDTVVVPMWAGQEIGWSVAA